MTPPIQIRTYQTEDRDTIIDIFYRSVYEVACCDYTQQQLAAWAPKPPDRLKWQQRLQTPGVFVGVHQENIQGFIRIEPNGHIDLLYVDSTALRRGVANTLLQYACQWATAQYGVVVFTTDASMTATPFFQKNHFQIIAEQEVLRFGVKLRNFKMQRAEMVLT